MSPEFAKAVDPIFLAAMDLESRIENGSDTLVIADERAILIQKLEHAERLLGKSADWELAKYALCSWIDAKLIQSAWSDAAWWKECCLEEQFFGQRLADEEFFTNAIKAGSLPSKNALEVYYLAVVMGFRGIYSDSDQARKGSFLDRHRLPKSIEIWCRETSKSLHLKRDRPNIPGVMIQQGNLDPLNGKNHLLQFSILSVLLVALAVVVYIILYVEFN